MLGRSGSTAILGALMATLIGAPESAQAQSPELPKPEVTQSSQVQPPVVQSPRAQKPATRKPLQVSIYGFLNAEAEHVWATGGPTSYGKRQRISDGNSRLGFAGSYEFMPKAKVLWQIEGSLGAFEQGGTNDKGISGIVVSRNTFAGVEEERIGRFLVGYNDSVYRSLIGSGSEIGGNLGLTSVGLDLWNNTSAQMTGNPDSIFSRGETRMKNSLHFLSRDWIVRFGASYSPDESVVDGLRRDRFSLAARFKMAGVQVGAGIDYQTNTGANTDKLREGLGLRIDGQPDVDTWYLKAVASYTAPTQTFVGLGWELNNYGYSEFVPASASTPYVQVNTGVMRQDAIMLSVAQSYRGFTAMVSGGYLGFLRGSLYFAGSRYSAMQFSLGAKYDFNEHFTSYAYGTIIENRSQQNVNLGQAPLYSNDAGTADAYLAPGNSPCAIGLGLVARFF